MKYFIAFALIAAVASAAIKPNPNDAELQAIIAAIQSPSTDPATAAALEEMLQDILGIKPEPVVVGPEIISPIEDISVGPAIIPFPLPDGGEVTAVEEPVAPAPVIVAPVAEPTPSASSPLVQIIVNVNQAASSPVSVGPAITPEIKPEPVHVVDSAAEPIDIVDSAPEPVQVVETAPEPVQVIDVLPEPVQVIEVAPAPAEPVQVAVPVLPEAAVVLPDELN